MWQTRDRSLRALGGELAKEAQMVYRGFDLLAEAVRIFETHLRDDAQRPLMTACGLAVIKCRRLLRGVLDMTLSGDAQESGVMLRVAQEYLCVLSYLSIHPENASKILDCSLDNAGELALETKKTLDDMPPSEQVRLHLKFLAVYKSLKDDYLQKHAAHMSFHCEAMKHLQASEGRVLNVDASFSAHVLRVSLEAMCSFLGEVALWAGMCLNAACLLPPEFAKAHAGYVACFQDIFDGQGAGQV